MSLIRFEKVTKTYAACQGGVFGLDFEISQGEFVYLIGSSGSGKSTVINLLIKNIEPDSGNISLSDINLEKVPTHIAIIMDGNGRWAKSRFLPRTAGHKAGVEAIREVIGYNVLDVLNKPFTPDNIKKVISLIENFHNS